MKLQDQRVVVLGGTSGIGLATAMAAAAQGAEVTVGSRNVDKVDKALAILPAGSSGRVVDLSDPVQIRRLFDDLGEIDHLVFTAGEPIAPMPLVALDPAAARNLFALRFFGALTAVQAAQVSRSITLTTGIAKDRPGPGWAVAASLCGAMEGLTRALAVELAPVRVNAVSPGVVRSPLWSLMADDEREQMYKEVGAHIPAGRVGEVEEIAEAYLFCMTQPFATGTVITVDGGTILV